MTEANLHLMDHPLILDKISLLRSRDTNICDFRRLVREIALLIGFEATRDLPLADYPVTTPITETVGKQLAYQICVVPILRAGLGMVDGLKTEKRLELERKLLNWLKQRSLAQIFDWFDCLEETTVKTPAGARRWTTEAVARDRLFLELLGVAKS